MIPVDENGQNNNNKTQFGMNLNDTFNFFVNRPTAHLSSSTPL